MRGALLGCAILLACEGGAAPADGGADAGVAPPAAPMFTPCPTGWRETIDASGLTSCDPWPVDGYRGADCAFDEVHWPGTTGCERIGTACAADGWPSDLPPDRPIAWVDASAPAGGDGTTRASAFRTIADASVLAPAGAVIAVHAGRYDEEVSLSDGMTLWGACVSATRIVTSAPSEARAALTLAGGASVRNLAIDGPARLGVSVSDGASAIDAVLVVGAVTVGVNLYGALTVTASDLVVRGTGERPSDGTFGRGIDVEAGAQLTLTRAVLEDNREAGLFTSRTGTIVTATDLVVRGTRERASPDHTLGQGIHAQGGPTLVLSRVLVENDREDGIHAEGTGTLVTATDVVVRGTRESASDGRYGRGISFEAGAQGTLSRVLVEDNREGGLVAGNMGTSVSATDVVVRGTRERPDGAFGRGIHAGAGAQVVLSRALIDHNRDVGILAADSGTRVTATDVLVRDTLPTSDGTNGMGIWTQVEATTTLLRARVERCHMAGIVAVVGATVDARDLVVSGVDPSVCAPGDCVGQAGGAGLVASGGTVSATRFTVDGATLCGVMVGAAHAGPSALDLTSGIVDHAAIGACVQVDGYDIERLNHDVVFGADVGVPLQATSYGFPTMLPALMP